MRCKKHPADFSSRVGVCASCLRESLFSLIAAQIQQAQSQTNSQTEDHRKSDPHRRKSDAKPPPLIFPRSVSPYICRRSDDSSWHHQQNDRRFYSTPQLGPNNKATASSSSLYKKRSKFFLFSLFTSSTSKSNEPDQGPRVSKPSLTTSSSFPVSSSWLSSFLHGRRKKKLRQFSHDETQLTGRRPSRIIDRGMSPARDTNEDEDYLDEEGSPSASGYSSESSQIGQKPAKMTPARRRRPPQHSRNLSGFAFCLSPLVWASPNNHRNQNGNPPGNGYSGDIGFSGEIRVSKKPHLSAAASFCANRSRKLADFGRSHHNHPRR